MDRKSAAGAVVIAVMAGAVLGGCFTGERPRLVDDTSDTPLASTEAQGIVDALTATPREPFTVAYDIVTKFGGQESKALITGDAVHGTAVAIGATTYAYLPDGRTFTCDTTADICAEGIDETRVSDRQLTSRFFKDSAVSRIRQDARVAVGAITFAIEQVAGTSALCIDVPVVDGNGATQTKSYCAFATFGVLASMDTADLQITATAVATAADLSYFEGLPL